MPNYARIAQIIHYGRGKEAKVLGPPFDIYRVGASSSGDYISTENRIFQNVSMVYKPNDRDLRETIESEKIPGVIMASLKVDVTQFQLKVGDILLNVDPLLQVGHNKATFETDEINAWLLAQDSAPKLTVGVRLNRLCNVFRPSLVPSVNGGWEHDSAQSLPIALNDGSFEVGAQEEFPAKIPIGMFPVVRPYGDRAYADTPNMPRKSGWACFVPPLKGFVFQEGDRVHTIDGSRYQVIIAAKQEVGLVGTYLFLERERA